ncbi:Hypothetical predicted protein [Paramuricea clavata]|uniref:Uncharacterized protein n=1 Tax=Paramuricea clavata TaxID=317549 RepID=A0A6S7FYB7_PARCT|nr:Hypothetical predicted protein [Paramuricea clavata]
MKPLSARDRRYSVINAKRSSTLLKEEGEPSTSTEQGETSTMAEVYTDKGEPSTSTLADQDEPSTWPGPSAEIRATAIEADNTVLPIQIKFFTTHDDSEDSDDDAVDNDREDDSNEGDLLEPSSQTETEEEPMMVDKTVSSDTEPEDENVTYDKSIFANNENLMMEPKFVVFLLQLLELFKVCATCKKPDVLVEMKEVGTMVQVEMTCNNKRCREGE